MGCHRSQVKLRGGAQGQDLQDDLIGHKACTGIPRMGPGRRASGTRRRPSCGVQGPGKEKKKGREEEEGEEEEEEAMTSVQLGWHVQLIT